MRTRSNRLSIAFYLAIAVATPLLASTACGSKKPRVVEPTPVETVADAGAGAEDAAPPAPKPLFERAGGKKVIDKVTDSFTKNLKADTSVKAFAKLTGAKLEAYKAAWSNVLCKESGGDCAATGTELKEAHKGMKLTEKQFESMTTDFKAALDEELSGADTEKGDMMAVFGQTKDQVVEVKPATKK
jgi:hemoglobin